MGETFNDDVAAGAETASNLKGHRGDKEGGGEEWERARATTDASTPSHTGSPPTPTSSLLSPDTGQHVPTCQPAGCLVM